MERALLVGVGLKGTKNRWSIESSINELVQLAHTAGAEVVGQIIQQLERPAVAYYVGSGKLKELVALRDQLEYEVVIFDDELSPRQQQNLENALQVKIVDRTTLILDIFACHAHTKEGQLQVELAQHQYLFSHLPGRWTHLERLGGGIGTRGPGESQIETDRRLIRYRIGRLKSQIEDVRKHRALYRKSRKKSGVPIVALVGYTNAGKSSLLNTLSNADVLVEDKLFATLDPVTRRLMLPDGQQVLLTDTVGFIRKLPTIVVAAFRATLEELSEASLLIHVVDISHREAAEQYQAVEDILNELNLANKPQITVLNKADLLLEKEEFEDHSYLERILAQSGFGGQNRQGMVILSALKGWGLESLLHEVMKQLSSDDILAV